MSSIIQFKPRIVATTLALLLASVASGQALAKTDLNELRNELEIMTSIFDTTMNQKKDHPGIKVRSIETSYLVNQGVVLEVRTSQSNRHFVFEFGPGSEFMVAPDAPVPPVPPMGAEQDFEIVFSDDDSDWSEMVEEAVEHARHAARETRERLRELHQRDREFSWELRDSERRLRDLEFEMRNADEERKKELSEQLGELNAEISKLREKQSSVEKKTQEMAELQKQKQQQKLALRQKQHDTFLAEFETNMSTTLCKYGNGLSSLPDSEHVSVVLTDFGVEESKRQRQDKIYVFGNQDIQSCSRGKLSAKQLLAKAQSYTF